MDEVGRRLKVVDAGITSTRNDKASGVESSL